MTTATMRLVAPVGVTRFSPQAESQLAERLRAGVMTEPVNIHAPDSLMLNAGGETRNGYQYTSTGFRQLCSRLLPAALADVLLAMVGQTDKQGQEEVYLPELATQTLNRLIRARFQDKLEGCGLILDTSSRRIEGVVGSRYQFFSNMELYEHVKDWLRVMDHETVFHGGYIAGKRLVIRFRHLEPAFGVPLPVATGGTEPFYAGWHFSNSEVGDSAIVGTAMLVREHTGLASLQPPVAINRVQHTQGGTFDSRVNGLFDYLAREDSDLSSCRDMFVRMRTARLGLGGGDHQIKARALRSRLIRSRVVSKRAAKNAVNTLIADGSLPEQAIQLQSSQALTMQSLIASRTEYDLYNALTHVAAGEPPTKQEAVEQLAWKLMSGQFSL